ncbi:MAG: hypothetical protein U1F57_06570 [bacterium]
MLNSILVLSGFSPSRFQPDVQVSRYRLADLEKVLNSDHSGDGQADFFDLYRRIFQGHDSLSFRRYLGLAQSLPAGKGKNSKPILPLIMSPLAT